MKIIGHLSCNSAQTQHNKKHLQRNTVFKVLFIVTLEKINLYRKNVDWKKKAQTYHFPSFERSALWKMFKRLDTITSGLTWSLKIWRIIKQNKWKYNNIQNSLPHHNGKCICYNKWEQRSNITNCISADAHVMKILSGEEK